MASLNSEGGFQVFYFQPSLVYNASTVTRMASVAILLSLSIPGSLRLHREVLLRNKCVLSKSSFGHIQVEAYFKRLFKVNNTKFGQYLAVCT